jgi:hypothetical protein
MAGGAVFSFGPTSDQSGNRAFAAAGRKGRWGGNVPVGVVDPAGQGRIANSDDAPVTADAAGQVTPGRPGHEGRRFGHASATGRSRGTCSALCTARLLWELAVVAWVPGEHGVDLEHGSLIEELVAGS